MSRTIDDRVLEMRFDNQQFESGVRTSLSTLERLKQSLNFKGAGKGLENIGAATKKVDMTGLGRAIESVGVKFSALQVMGVTALANIANSAVNAGKRIVSALTITPPKDGFMEYETQINSTQTIMANTGESVETVNKALDELNEYADLTIYNFTEMTRNAGMFTAAGVKLPETMTALKGIGNWAAYAGANSSDMARATYQLGQALATGTIRLRDWMSIENTGGMAGKKYQEAFMETARQHGIAVDQIVAANGSFRDSLQEGWLTSEIFIETMQRFANDQSMTDAATKIKTFSQLIDTVKEALGTGWATTWRTIIGDFEEAKTLWTSVNDVIGGAINKMSDARNQMLAEWKHMGGRDMLMESFKNVYEGLKSIITPIKEAFSDIFPPITAQRLLAFTEGLKNLTAKFKISETTANNLKTVFKGVFSIFSVGVQVIKTLGSGLLQLSSFIAPLGSKILSVAAAVGNLLIKFKEWLSTNNILREGLSKLASGLKNGINSVKNFIKQFSSLPQVQQAFVNLKNGILNMLSGVRSKLTEGASIFKDFISRIKSMDSLSIDGLLNVFKSFKTRLTEYFSGIGESIGNIKSKIVSNVKQFGANVQDALGKIGNGFGAVKGKISEFVEFIKSKLSGINLGNILTVAMGASLILFIRQLSKAFGALSDVFDGVAKVIKNFGGIFKGITKVLKAHANKTNSEAILNIAKSIGLLVGAITLLTTLDSDKVWSSVGVLGVVAAGLIAFSAALGALGKLDFKGVSTKSLLAMTVSILILSVAIKQLGKMDTGELLKGTAYVAALMAFFTVISAIPKYSGGGKSILAMSAAILLITEAIKQISDLDSSGLAQGMKCVTQLMAIFSAITVLSRFAGSNASGAGKGILAMSVGLLAISAAMKIISGMDPGDLSKGLSCVTMLMAIFTVVMALSKFSGANAGKAGAGILGMTSAILVLSVAMKIIAGMEPGKLAKGLACVTVLMAVFAGVVALSKFAGANAAKAGVMLLAMSGAIMVLSVCMMLLSQLDPSGLGRAVAAIAAVEVCFALLIGVTKLAENCKGTLITLTVAIGILAGSLGLLSMLDPGSLMTASACLSGVIAMFALLVASTSLIQNATGTLLILGAMVAELGGILYLLSGLPIESTIGAAASLSILLLSLSAACAIIGTFGNIAPTALASVAAMTIIVAALGGILTAISGLPIESTLANSASLSVLLLSLSAACGILSAVGVTGAAGFVGIGVLSALIVAIGGLLTGIGALVTKFPMLEEFLNNGIPILEKIGYALGSFFGNIVGGFLGGMSTGIEQVGTSLSNFMTNLQPFIEGARGIDSSVTEGVKNLAQTLLILAGVNIAESFASWLAGGSSIADFANQIAPLGEALASFGTSVSGINEETLNKIKMASEAAKALASFASSIPNSGGLVSVFTGDNNLISFARQLKPFGEALSDYASSTTNIDKSVIERIKNTAEAAKALTSFASSIPNSGGLVSAFTGDNSLTAFARQLKPFGEALSDFAASTSNLGDDVIDKIHNIAEAAQALSEFAASIPNSGGLVSAFTGDNSLTAFAQQLKPFGEALKDFVDSVSDIDASAIQEPINAIIDAVDSLSNIDTSGINSSALNIVSEFTSTLGSAAPQVTAAGSNLGQNLVSGLQSQVSAVASAGQALGQAGAIGAGTQVSVFGTIGQNMALGLVSGLQSQATAAAQAGQSLGQAGASGAGTQVSAFNSIGYNMAAGLAAGISSGASQAVSAAVSMATSALQAAKKALQVQSPSRAFMQIGKFAGEGLAIGIDKSTQEVTTKSKELAADILYTTKKALDINSPSKVMRDKVGRYIVKGVAEGITKDMSAEEAAEKKAQNITEAFKRELDRLDLWDSIFDLTHQLWELQDDGASDALEKSTRNLELLSSQVDRQTQKVELATGEYQQMVQYFGESSDEALEANKKLLEQQIKLEEISNSLFYATQEHFIAPITEKNEEYKSNIELLEKEINLLEKRSDLTEGDKSAQKLKLLNEQYKKQNEIAWNAGVAYEEIAKLYSKDSPKALELYGIWREELDKWFDLANAINDTEFEFSKNWIDREKSYNRLDEQGEIDAWNRILRAHWDETDRREEAHLKIYELTHKQMEGDIDLIQKAIDANVIALTNLQYGTIEYENAVKENAYLLSMLKDAKLENSEQWISRRDTFGRERGLAEELSEAIRVQQRYEKGTETREEYDKKVYELEKEIYEKYQDYQADCEDLEQERSDKRIELEEKYADKVQEVNDKLEQDIQELNDTYEDALESRTKTLYDSYKIFDEVDRDKSAKASSLMRNLQDQVAYFEDWNTELNKLSGRGLNEALIDELQEMGPSAYAEIKALNSMTDTQLSQYANLWADKHKLASDRATDELEDMRIETENQISELRANANEELNGLADDLAADLADMNADIDERLRETKETFEKAVGLIRTDTVNEFLEMDKTVKEEILKPAGYSETGEAIVDGLTEGVDKARPRFVEEIVGLSSDAIEALRSALKIGSPSKVFAEIGGFMGQGLIVGIKGTISPVEDTTETLGQRAVDAIGNTIGMIYRAVNDSPISNPTIRPIIDLANVNEGISYMDGAFAARRSLILGASFANENQNGKLSQISDAISGLKDSNLASNSKVAEAIEGLKKDFAGLVDKVSRLQVVMDTGRLVGEIAPEMDRSLGVRANMNRRGV